MITLNGPPQSPQVISPENRYWRLAADRFKPPFFLPAWPRLVGISLATASHSSSDTMRHAGTSTRSHSDSGRRCCSFCCESGFHTTLLMFQVLIPLYFVLLSIRRTMCVLHRDGTLPRFKRGAATPSSLSFMAITLMPAPP